MYVADDELGSSKACGSLGTAGLSSGSLQPLVLVLLGCVGMMPLKQILPHGTRDMRGEEWYLMEIRGSHVVSEVK
jgi:hypothetical protein